MDINKVDIGYFEFLKENFNTDLIVEGITISIFAIIVFSIFFLSVEKIKLSSSFILHSIIVNYKEDFIAQCCSIDSTIDTDLYQKQLKLMDKYINMYLDIINIIKNMEE